MNAYAHAIDAWFEREAKQPEPIDATLKELIEKRDQLASQIATTDSLIRMGARLWANERGLKVLPRIEQLRNEVGA